MQIKLKTNLLKLGMSLLVVGSMASTVVGQHAFAAACSPTTPLDSTGNTTILGSVGCTTTFSAENPLGELTLEAPATVAGGIADLTTKVSSFSFDTTVDDDRSSAAGWNLQAASTGLTTGTGGAGKIAFPSFTAAGSSITPTALDGGVCATTTSNLDLTVSSTSGPFARAADNGATTVNCSYAIVTAGTIDFTGEAAGVYTGDVTLTLLNTAAGA